MKKLIFQVICLVVFGISALHSHAQLIDYRTWSQEKKENKSLELINEAEYVVEGQIVKFECFYGDDGKTAYTDLTVKVNHWYKGKGEDIVHIIKKREEACEGVQMSSTYTIQPYTPMGSTYILLLKQHNSGENYVFSRYSGSVVARSIDNFYMVGFHGLLFDNAKEFNQFIAKGDKIKIPQY